MWVKEVKVGDEPPRQKTILPNSRGGQEPVDWQRRGQARAAGAHGEGAERQLRGRAQAVRQLVRGPQGVVVLTLLSCVSEIFP